MATYYRWRKSTISYSETSDEITTTAPIPISNTQTFYIRWAKPGFVKEGYDFSDAERLTVNGASVSQTFMNAYVAGSTNPTEIYTTGESTTVVNLYNNTACILPKNSGGTIYVTKYTVKVTAGSFVEYVYSLNSSAYPSDGISGDYYYDIRTTITSPTAPSSISYPATITTPSVTVSWTAASSSVPSYSVNLYELSYSTNGGSSWTVIGTTASTSYSFSIPAGTTSIMFRVRARDSNNQYGAYTTGTAAQVILAPTLTVPEMVMQGQSATVSWSEVEGADSYTLERKSSADADWTQVYSGANLSYTETVGTWTSLQYRVCAVFGETSGGWATSGDIQIVAASALVISGSDGDLGTLTSDVSYSVSSDQTAPVIDVTVTVNGGEYASFQATSGQNYSIGVLDLPTGTGSIVITATTEVSEAPVTVTRTWTYTKAAQSFPNAGSVARLTQEGDTIWPQTLAEAVRTTGGPWGGDLSKALNLLMKAATYDKETGDFSDLWGNDIPTVKIETGSYTGTGTYGSDNPNVITTNFEPKIVFIMSDYYSGNGGSESFYVLVNGITRGFWSRYTSATSGNVIGNYQIIPTFSENSVQYYAESFTSAENQGNISGLKYAYVAIG